MSTRQKLLISFVLFFIIPFNVFSGISSIGITGGCNLAKFNDSDIRPGLVLGISSESDSYLIKNLSACIEILYIENGGKKPENTYRVIYTDIPLLLKYSFKSDKTLFPFIKLGTSIGFMAHSQIIKDIPSYKKFTVNNKEETNPVNINAIIGLGFNFNIAKNICFIEARYAYGFEEMFKNMIDDINKSIQIMVGFTRPLK